MSYTAITPGTIPLVVGARRAIFLLNLRTSEDAFDHADFPLTITATASPSGMTATTTLTLLDDDIRITTTTAVATVSAGATATYDVQLSEQPPAATTVTVASQGTGMATVSPATLTFTTGNWNTAQTVTVTGVTTGSTTIRHSAPAASGFSYVTNNVAVTVTAPVVAAPVFTNAAAFTSPIEAAENQSAVRGADYFGASDTSTGNLVLSGADMSVFTLSPTGTLTFNDAPNFEMPRGTPITGTNTNNYALTVAATNSAGTTTANFTVRVTDVNDVPVLDAFTLPTFTEYSAGTYTFTATDEDRPAQTLSFSLAVNTIGAAMTTAGVFTWTPREADGRVARTFTVMVSDGIGSPPTNVPTAFTITAMELPNRPPTNAAITIAGGATMVTSPDPIGVSATASDPDTGDRLTYTWSSSATDDTFVPATGPSVTWTPPILATDDTVRMITLMVTASDGTLTDTATYTIAVNPPPVVDAAPAFTVTSVPAQNYIVGTMITPLTLPAATGGNGDIVYALSPPPGLTFDPATRAITGTPTTAVPAANFAYTARDSDDNMAAGDRASQSISITVRTPATGFTVSVVDGFDNTGVSTVREGDSRNLRVVAVPAPAGSAFAAAQQLTFTVTPPPLSSPPANAADPYVAYTAVTPGTIPLAAGGTTASFTFTMATTDDAFDYMDFPLTLTATALPSGITGMTTLTLLDDDIGITTTTAAATVAAGGTATATYDVQLGEAPPADTIVTVASLATATATVSPATLTFTTTNWNTAQSVTVTGVALGSTTIRHSAPASGFSYVTNDVAVTVTDPAVAAPAFTNAAAFATPIEAAENQSAVRAAGYFRAPVTGTGNLVLSGADMSFFTLSFTGTLTFNDPPNFERPRGMAFNAGSNTNDYALTVAATNSTGTTTANFTVRVTDVNDVPVFDAFTLPTFTEYSAGTYTVTATDEDRPAQTLSFSLAANTVGAAMTTAGVFTWTPGEDDGGVARTFTVMVTDGIGTPPANVDTAFTITAMELANRAPTGASITIADGATMVTNPATLDLTAAATDPDTGDTLTYAWSSSATGGSFTPATGATTTTTWMPPTVTAATMVTLTVTITDSTDGSVTATQNVMVNPAGTAPAFADDAVIPVQRYSIGMTIPTLTLPEATGGTAPLTYTLARVSDGTALPAGLTFNADARPPTITGTPTEQTGGASGLAFAYTVADGDGNTADTDTDTLFFTLEVALIESALSFPRTTGIGIAPNSGTIDLFYPLGQPITPTTFPAASGGVTPYIYSVGTDSVPVGLTFDAATRALTGTPSVAGEHTFRYVVTDSAMLPIIDSVSTDVTICESGGAADGATACTAPTFVTLALTAPADQSFASGTAITPLTLSVATGGTGANPVRIYTATPLPAGLTFDPISRVITGTPTTAGATTTVSYRVGDAGSGNSDDRSTTVTFDIVVTGTDTAPAFAAGTSIAIKFFTQGTMASLTLPEATGGNGLLSYALTFPITLPAGLTFDPTTRVLSGTSTSTRSGRIGFRYVVTDADDNVATSDSDSLDFGVRLTALNRVPTFADDASIADMVYLTGEVVDQILPRIIAGTGNTGVMYTLTPALPAGLTFTHHTAVIDTRAIAGIPTAATATTTYTFTATDNDGNNDPSDTDVLEFTITIVVDTIPAFAGGTSIADQTYTQGTAITPLTLPLATGGNGALTYALTPAIPGLTFDAATRVLSGTSTDRRSGRLPFSYVVTDADSNEAPADAARLSFAVRLVALDTVPTFADDTSIADMVYLTGEVVDQTLPRTIVGTGNDDITYTLTPALPAGLTFAHAVVTQPPTITGTPTAVGTETVTYTLTARDSDGNNDPRDTDVLEFSITVNANTVPAFADGASIPVQRYVVGTTIATLTLPEATGGTAPLTYTLARVVGSEGLPPGLTFDGTVRPPTMTGTPTEQTGGASGLAFAYTVADGDGNIAADDTDTLFFALEVALSETVLSFPSTTGIGTTPNSSTIRLFYPIGAAITPTTFPPASGGTAPYTYSTGSGTLPVGLTFDADFRVLSGTPSVAGANRFGYVVTDSATPQAISSLSVAVTICESDGVADGAIACTAPTFVDMALTAPANQSFASDTAIAPLTLPAATGGSGTNPVYIYTATPLPAGLTFDPTSRAITGTPTIAATTTTVSYRVGDAGSGNTDPRSVTVMFDIVVTGTDTAPVFGAGVTIPDQTYTQGTAITPLTLPTATGGNGPLTHALTTLTSMLPPGLTFDPATRVISGTSTDPRSTTLRFNWVVTDADDNVAPADSARLSFDVRLVGLDTAPTFADDASIADRLYLTGEVVDLTLPVVAAGTGNAPIDYTLTPTLPVGLTFTVVTFSTRAITGTPAAATATTTYTLTATDNDDNAAPSDTDTLTFTITVEVDATPTFAAGVTIPDQTYMQGTAITPLTLPTATGGNGALTYALTGNTLPPGLTFDAATGVISGTSTDTRSVALVFHWMVTDADNNEATDDSVRLSFAVTLVAPDTAPNFDSSSPSVVPQTFLLNRALDLTLPMAIGGNGALTYTLTPAIPGLTLDPATRVLSGTPTTEATAADYTYTVTDGDMNTAADDTATLTISITVMGPDTVPAFADDASIADMLYLTDVVVDLTLPLVAAGTGNVPVTYTLTPALPAGLTFAAAARPPTITGTPTAAALTATYTLTATDGDDDTDTLEFSITVETDSAPVFGAGVTIPAQIFTRGTAITPLTLPTATGGNGALAYALTVDTLPPGLTFDAATRVISGTSTDTRSTTLLFNWVVTDADDNEATDDSAILAFTAILASPAPTFATVYVVGEVVDQTLPIAIASTGATTYALTPDLPAGLALEILLVGLPPSIGGTPTAVFPTTIYTLIATDADDNTTMLRFTITVEADTAPAFADGAAISDRTFMQGTAITPLTLPGATGGNGALSYALTNPPTLPAGLTLDPSTRVLSGTSTDTRSTTVLFNWRVTDADANEAISDSALLAFAATLVALDTAPAFADSESLAVVYVTDVVVDQTLPVVAAGTGNDPIAYTLTPTLPAGLTFNPAFGVRPPTITGTPTVATSTATYTLTATDDDDDTDTLEFTITIETDTAPAFATGAVIPGQTFTQGTAITPLTLPTATGGNGALTYALVALTGMLPPGLTFDPATRVISGTSTDTRSSTLQFDWVVTDADDNVADADSASLTFSVTLVGLDTAPTFADDASIADMVYLTGEVIDLTLPVVTVGTGNAPIAYTLTPTLPPGLTFTLVAFGTRGISGIPTAAAATTTYTLTATDNDDNAAPSDTGTLTFTITVIVDTAPAFAADAAIEAQTYMQGTAITPLTLPAATGGNGDIVYALTPAIPGLTLDPATRVLTGTPTTVAVAANFAYTARDSDGDTASLSISITVRAPATGFTVSVVSNPGSTAVSTVLEGTTRDVRVVAVPTPAGSIFAADQQVTFTVTPAPLSSPPANAADPFVAYTAIAPGTIPLAVGAANATFTFTIATTDDALDHADFPLTLTATAAPSGITGMTTLTLLDDDIGITTTTAAATVAVGATATYGVQLSGAPPATTTVTVASQGTATATVSPATRTFTTTNWNTAQTVTVTGVATGSTTIRHTAPDTSGFAYITNDVAVTVTSATVPPVFIPPVFTNPDLAAFEPGGMPLVFEVTEKTLAVNAANFFAATMGTGGEPATVTLSGPDVSFFSIADGTMTFNHPPDFEMPRGMPFDSVTNNNDYLLTLTANPMVDIIVRVVAQDTAPTFGTATIPAQHYAAGKLLSPPLTLPAASGGNGDIMYNLLGPDGLVITDLSTVIPGLTLDTAARTITGAPTTTFTLRTYTWVAHDSDDNMTNSDRARITFTIAVGMNRIPTFADGVSIANQNYLENSAIEMTLPAVTTDGNAPLTYTLTPAIPGLTLNPRSHVLTGAPTTATTSAPHTYRVTDADGETDTLTFSVVVATDFVPTFGTATIADQSFTIGEVVALTLPGVSAGSGNISIHYTLTPALPAGLTFDPATGVRTITGMPTTAAATMEYTYMATDGDGNTAPSDTDSLTFNLVVMRDTVPSFDDVTIINQVYTENTMITPLTLPEATGGNDPLTYTLTFSGRYSGLTFDPATRVLSGTAFPSFANILFTYKVTDAEGDSAMKPFLVTIEAGEDTAPNFGSETIDDMAYITGEMVNQTLPLATVGTGNAPIAYTLTPALPTGLTFNLNARPPTITGTPTAAPTATYIYTVADSDSNMAVGDTSFLTFTITVAADTTPVFTAGAAIPAQTYVVNRMVNRTLPAATGGNGATTYSLVAPNGVEITDLSSLIPGLTFDAATRTITGTPTAAVATAAYTYTAADSDNNAAGTDEVSLMFSITVETNAAPAFTAGANLPARTYVVDLAIAPFTLPAATGGNGATTYTLTPPTGLTFNPATRVLTGTPTTVATATMYTYTAGDSDASAAGTDEVSLVWSITVEADTAPAFAAGANIPGPTFEIGMAIEPLTLPVATGGNGPVSYALTPVLPIGLTFNGAVITGTPTSQNPSSVEYTYTASDTDVNTAGTDEASLRFVIRTIRPVVSPHGIALSINPSVVTESATATTITVTATVLVETFAEERVVGFGTATTGTATTGIDYMPVAVTNLTIPANAASGSATISFTALVDTETEAGGETVPIIGTFYLRGTTNKDTSISVAPTTLTIHDPTGAPTFAGANIPDQLYYTGSPIPPLTLPAATGGSDGVITYTLTPAIAGLTLDPTTRVLTGAPTTVAVVALYTYTAHDGDGDMTAGDSATLTFNVRVEGNIAPDFAMATVAEQIYTQNGVLEPLTLPAASGGNGALTYTLTPALPAGLTFDGATRALSGRPTTVATTVLYTYRVADGDDDTEEDDTDMLIFGITVEVDTTPSFGGTTVPDQTYTVGTAIEPLTLPTAADGNAPITYSLTPPAGLTFTAGSRVLSGTPTAVVMTRLFTYMVADVGLDADRLTFSITVNAMPEADTTPSFGGATVPDQAYMQGTAIVPLTLPAATGGNDPITYTLTPSVPGLTFDPMTRVLSGTPTAVVMTGRFSYMVRDAMLDADRVQFGITVAPATTDIAPTFGGATIAARIYAVDTAIEPLTLPIATGGNDGFTYTMTLPAGMTFDPMTRVFSGTPTTVAVATDYTYTVADGDTNEMPADTDVLTFNITIAANTAPAFADGANIDDQDFLMGLAIEPLTLPTATGGNGATIYTLVPALAGLTLDPATGVLTGAPTAAAGAATMVTYTANDADDDTTAGDADTLTFSVTVVLDIPPDFGAATIADQSYIPGETVALTLPLVVDGTGNIAIFYELTPVLPSGLTFDGVARPPTITGRPSSVAALETFVYRATDGDANTAGTDAATLTFTITVSTMSAADSTPSLADPFISDLFYTQHRTITPFTLPAATGGNAPLTYTLTPPVPGLTFDPITLVLSGTPTTAVAERPYTYMVTDRQGDADRRMVRIAVFPADTSPSFGGATVPAQSYTQHSSIAPLTLPAATGGNVPITYSLSPPAGLTFDPMTRVLSGTPTAAAVERPYAYMVTDRDSDADRLMISITVAVEGTDTAPTFGGSTIVAQTYTVDTAIEPLTLPVATGGNDGRTYTLTPLIAGLTFDPMTRVLSGTPTTIAVATDYTYTVADGDMNDAETDTATLMLSITVEAMPDTAPTFGINPPPIADRIYVVGGTVVLTLPVATGGNGALTYTLTPAIAGLTLDPATGVLTGMPTTDSVATDYTYTVADGDMNDAETDTDTIMVNITVEALGTDIAPAFAANAFIPARTFFQNVMIEPITLPAVATPGNGPTIYTLAFSPTQPLVGLGLTLDPMTRVLTGAPQTLTPLARLYHTAADSDGNTEESDTDRVSTTFTVHARDTRPTFAANAMIADLTFVQNRRITPITLPTATGGNGIHYSLTGPFAGPLPAGLYFSQQPSVISGMPTATAATETYTYTARDFDVNTASSDEDTLSFSITVGQADPTGITLSVDPAQVTESSAATTITVTAALTGGTFTADRVVSVQTIAGGTATLNTDYTTVFDTTLTIPANMIRGSATFAFAGSVDTVADDGETVNIGGSLYLAGTTSPDTSISVTPTALTINDYVPVTADAGADQILDPGSTITLNGEATGGPTATLATSWALSDAATTTALIAAQVPMADATTEVTRLTTALAAIMAEDGSLTAPALSLGLTSPVALAFTFTVTDSAGPAGQPTTATDEVIITMEPADIVPTFGTTTIPAQTYTMGQTITPLTLPVATGGNGPGATTYSLTGTLPAGLTYTAADRTITGTLTTVAAAMDYIWTAADGDMNTADDDSVSLMFSITVGMQATGFTVRVFDALDATVIPMVLEGSSRDYRVTATPTPAGSAFAADQQVTFTVAPPLSSPPANAADPYVLYTAVPPGTIPLAAGGASATFTFTMATTDDAFDHANFPVTITATASPSGMTDTTTGLTLIDNDVGITTTLAATTVVAGATATYDVQLGEVPPSDVTVTVASQGTATATVSPAELRFGRNSWNTARTVTVTGVAAGSTTIRHSAPDGTNVTFVTNDVAVTVIAPDTAPSFGSSSPSVAPQTFTLNTAVDLTLPAATGGNAPLIYTLTPALPPGLTLDPATRVLSGTPTTASVAVMYTYTAADSDGNTEASDTATLTISIAVMGPDTAPSFAPRPSPPRPSRKARRLT